MNNATLETAVRQTAAASPGGTLDKLIKQLDQLRKDGGNYEIRLNNRTTSFYIVKIEEVVAGLSALEEDGQAIPAGTEESVA